MLKYYHRFIKWCSLGWLWEWTLKQDIANHTKVVSKPQPKKKQPKVLVCNCNRFNCPHMNNPLHIKRLRTSHK